MNYKEIARKARAGIAKNGSLCRIKRVNGETYDPDTNEYTTTYSYIDGFAVQDNYSESEVDGTVIQMGDARLMAVFEEKLLMGDVLEFGGKDITVVSVPKAIAPDGMTVLYYEVQCR